MKKIQSIFKKALDIYVSAKMQHAQHLLETKVYIF
jgi:hypothetical protein